MMNETVKLYYTQIALPADRAAARQTEHRAGRQLLCHVLNCQEDDILLHPGGKPYLPGGPHFSLSHSGGIVLLAVCEKSPVGCDVEPLSRTVHNEAAVRRKIARPGDEALPFLQLWVKHEALLKSGLGEQAHVHYPEMPEGFVAAVACITPPKTPESIQLCV